MHLHGLKPWDIDRMTVKDFHLACEWVDEYYRSLKEA